MSKPITYPLSEGTFLTFQPLVDQTINILRFREDEGQEYNIIINRAALEEDQTVEEFCENQWETMQRNVPGFELEGKSLTHEIGPAKLPVLQRANKYLENGIMIKQVLSVVSLPRHPQLNPDARNLIIFTLTTNGGDFTEFQRMHYVKIINSFVPTETSLSTKN